MIDKPATAAKQILNVNVRGESAAADLARAGLTPEQIRRLQALRDRYHPLIEQVETRQQWEQLQFLRWLYREGLYPRG